MTRISWPLWLAAGCYGFVGIEVARQAWRARRRR
jgi:hypothetical protein